MSQPYRHPAIVLAVLTLAVSMGLPTALAAGTASPEISRDYVLGGSQEAAAWPPGPGEFLRAEHAAGVATCTSAELEPGLGGDCISLAGAAAGTVAEVRVISPLPSAAGPVAFAAGYDLDDDGCVGCTEDDKLYQGEGRALVPVLDRETTLAVFVYGTSASQDGLDTEARAGLVGTITVDTQEEPAGSGGSSDPRLDDGTTVPSSYLEPHLCVPQCSA